MRYKIEREISDGIRHFRKTCEGYSDESVAQFAELKRQIRLLISKLMATGLGSYPKVDKSFHKVTTDSIGTFIAVIGAIEGTRIPILIIKRWDWRINPQVFNTIYPLLLQEKPIYDVISTDDCGFSVVKDARGYFNHINSQKQVISKEWLQKVTPFQNINGNIFAYVRRLNGDVCFIFDNGMLGKIDDNRTRYYADALLGESRMHQIIMEVINQYLRQNLIIN